jgi:hypothetical protein
MLSKLPFPVRQSDCNVRNDFVFRGKFTETGLKLFIFTNKLTIYKYDKDRSNTAKQ